MNFLEQLKAARERRAALLPKIQAAVDAATMDALELELRKLNTEIATLEGLTEGQEKSGEDPATRSLEEPGKQGIPPLNPLTAAKGQGQQRGGEDPYGTLEYRMAFRNYIVSGTPIPEQFRPTNETRADALTVVSDIGAVIPTTIQNQVIEDLTSEGTILSRITQTSFQGAVQIPISEINPTATWLTSEETVSDEQKAKMDAKLSFGYHVLEAKIAIGLLTSTVALSVFEATVTRQLKKAMIRALEKAIVSGTGNGQPSGFIKFVLPESQTVIFTAAQVDTVKGWARAEAAIPEVYETGEIYMMSKQTWEMHLNSMVDTAGQKIGLGKINEKGQKILNGREVLTTDQLPSFDSAASGDTFGVLINLEEYCLNSNLNMYYKKYFNEDKNKWIHKALMIADGKMTIGTASDGTTLVGAKGLIYLKKA